MGEGDTSGHNTDVNFYEFDNVAAESPAVLALKPEKPTVDDKGNARKKPGTYNETYQTEYVKFVNQLMNPNPDKRLTPAQALEHPFMKNRIIDDKRVQEIIEGINAPPSTRPDPAAEFKKKLADWTPLFKTALKANGPNAPEINKLLAQAIAQSKPGGNMDQALAQLAECHRKATER